MSLSTQDITRQWASLPTSQIAVGVNDALHTNSSLVVTAPPGAGKSTLLPLTILSSLGEGEKILMLEHADWLRDRLRSAWRRCLASRWAKP